MRRLHGTDLDTRIDNFLQRKLAQFPELQSRHGEPANRHASKQPRIKHFHSEAHWGTKALMGRI